MSDLPSPISSNTGQRTTDGGRHFRTRWLWLLILIISVFAFGAGLILGEAEFVLEKAVNVCLSCIGIG